MNCFLVASPVLLRPSVPLRDMGETQAALLCKEALCQHVGKGKAGTRRPPTISTRRQTLCGHSVL